MLHTSTYRLQLNAGFTLADALALQPYLEELGVGALYLSPPFTAREGSTHGYDVVNHNEVSPALGGLAAFRHLAGALRANGMGLLVDFVPNHMGNDPATNEWWWDVLENGPSSPYAHYFDIDWEPLKPELKNRVLLPVLGEQYGDALEGGRLRLLFDAGTLMVVYNDLRLPLNPRRLPMVLESEISSLIAELGEGDPSLREFLSIITALKNLPPYTESRGDRIAERQREKEIARERLVHLLAESSVIAAYIQRVVTAFNGTVGDLASFARLHELLELQAYRLASWRTAWDEINFRRFFDINELAGLRVEAPDVFDGIHRLVLQLVGEGLITGLRIDHIDGLLDPAAYLARLQANVQGARPAADAAVTDGPPFYVVVEKILSVDEVLPGDWPVAGTTGYNFLNDVNGVFVDTRQARAMRRVYTRLTGQSEPAADVIYHAKRLIIATAMSSEFRVIASAANRLSERNWRWRDFTYGSISRALREILACFPVYRTYVTGRGVFASDRAAVDAAIRTAQVRNPSTEPSIFEFLRTVLLPERTAADRGHAPDDQRFEERLNVATRFQQYSAPVHAKGVEDTACYRDTELLSLNEVGGSLLQFGRPLDAFHRANAQRAERWPYEMTATATHDTKRGEDARARLNVLSEMPAEWRDAALSWMRINRAAHVIVDSQPAPDRNDEQHAYQALLAIWPAGHPHGTPVPPDLIARLGGYMLKAVREAKLHTSWVNPNLAYEAAMATFLERTLAGDHASEFLAAFGTFADRVAELGAINSLAQLVLKLASPGIPDFYQGTELWDLSLVDPDNRRAVDFGVRRQALASLASLFETGAGSPGHPGPSIVPDECLSRLLTNWSDGAIKLFVTAVGLRLRRARPDLFLRGSYSPVAAVGWHAEHVVAFARQHEDAMIIAAVPRLPATLEPPEGPPLLRGRWRDTRLRLPADAQGREFRNVMTGDIVKGFFTTGEHWLPVGRIFERFPVALLVAQPSTITSEPAGPDADQQA